MVFDAEPEVHTLTSNTSNCNTSLQNPRKCRTLLC